MTTNMPKGITKCAQPKMSNHRGRTWDRCEVILPNGDEIAGYLDTTWGTRFYFQRDGAWRCGQIMDFERGDIYGRNVFDLRRRNAR